MAENLTPEFKIWYRHQFLNNVCHVCKSLPKHTTFKCFDCSMVTYCSQQHLDEDIDDHEDICDALREAARILGTPHPHDKGQLLGPEQWREFRLGLVALCSKHLGRPLASWEMEICLFPPLCSTCRKVSPTMERCSKCFSVNWCTDQHRPAGHAAHCDDLNLFRRVLEKKIKVVKGPQLMSLPSNIHQLLPDAEKDGVHYCLLTEIATSPLSTLHHLPDTTKAVVHIIGPEPHFEANNLIKWEVFLFNLRPSLADLTLNFIGPEIGNLPTRTWNRRGRCLTFTFHPIVYHEFISSEHYSRPTLICAFNPGLYRAHGFNGLDSWARTIDAMFEQEDIPVLVTAYTRKEITLDFERVTKQISRVKTLVPPSRNQFSSLRPLMNFVSDELTPVVFKNAFCTVLKT